MRIHTVGYYVAKKAYDDGLYKMKVGDVLVIEANTFPTHTKYRVTFPNGGSVTTPAESFMEAAAQMDLVEIDLSKNRRRNRVYGLRVGDRVERIIYYGNKESDTEATVIAAPYALDNNRVLLVDDSGDVFDWVAECCTVLDKVEDRILTV